MARIRSIKPEFWTDGKNLRLSDSCALFYVALWNFCDDEGKHVYDLDQLVAELGSRWHRGKVQLFVSCLIKSGQLRINSTSTWIQVVHWSHQKIDKPKQPEVKAVDIQWVTETNSTNGIERSRPIDARIGSDRIGSDQGSDIQQAKDRSTNRQRKEPKEPQAVTTSNEASEKARAFVDSYCRKFKAKYGSNPQILGKDAGIAKRLAKDLGFDRFERLLDAYFEMGDPFLVSNRHPMNLFETKLQAISVLADTGRQNSPNVSRRQQNLNELLAHIQAQEDQA